MSALTLTGADLVRALRQFATAAVDRAVQARAEAVAQEVEARRPEAVVRVIPHAPAETSVAVSASGLFARQFGALDALAESPGLNELIQGEMRRQPPP